MFTGLVEAAVPVTEIRRHGGALDLTLDPGDAIAAGQRVGQSLAVNGACLTVAGIRGRRCLFNVIEETLCRTNLGDLRVGDRVNVERPLKVGDELGGHWVQGHVDGTGILASRQPGPGQTVIRVRARAELTAQMVPKGSICVEGVSLTLVEVGGDWFTCALIPETLTRTTLGHLKPGARVNLETDILAKYVRKLVVDWRSR